MATDKTKATETPKAETEAVAGRPEWVKCIQGIAATGVVWCGRDNVRDFTFVDTDHALRAKSSRLRPCPDCVIAAVKALKEMLVLS